MAPLRDSFGAISVGFIKLFDKTLFDLIFIQSIDKSTGIGFVVGLFGALFGVLNLRANTPTEWYPNGWQIGFPRGISETQEENATLGGRNYRNILRVHWTVPDPGRKGLE